MKDSFFSIFLVGIGGFFGSVSRYFVTEFFQRVTKENPLPFGTFAVNILGCFIIGFLGSCAERSEMFSPKTHLMLFVGFLGGLTTFSTFGYETMMLFRDQSVGLALLNILGHVAIGLLSVYSGYSLSVCAGCLLSCPK